MTPDDIAKRCAAAMWASDGASQWMGLELVSVTAGQSEMRLKVEKHHCNGHGNCHGGVIFTLADSSFAFACNSRNKATVSQHNMITYVAPVHLNDTLTAHAVEVSLTGRNSIYDVTVTNQNNVVVAEFRGFSRAIKGQLFVEEPS